MNMEAYALGVVIGFFLWGCICGGVGMLINRLRGTTGGFKTGFIVGCVINVLSMIGQM